MFLRDVSLTQKRVLVRVDLNAPFLSVKDFRLNAPKETIEHLKGNKIVLLTHLGNDESTCDLAPFMEHILSQKVLFVPHYDPYCALDYSDIVLLENIRFFKGEAKNDPKVAELFSKGIDVFVNEAFSCSHRKHASIMQFPHILPSFLGYQFEKELTLSIKRPSMLILGGRKVSSKVGWLNLLQDKFDYVFLGGVFANTFLKARGFDVGCSAVDEAALNRCAAITSENIILPEDVICRRGIYDVNAIDRFDTVRDIGPKSIEQILELSKKVSQVVWNGPLGNIENGRYKAGSLAVLEGLAGKDVIIGGGDTLTLVDDDTPFQRSTGGGALLYYLAYGTLPGLEAVNHGRTFEV